MSRAKSINERIPNGAYYTPDALGEALVGLALPHLKGLRVLEPGVGGGAFARPMLDAGLQVVGVDIDKKSTGLYMGDLESVHCDVTTWDDRQLGEYGIGAMVGNPDWRIAQEVAEMALTDPGVRHVFLLLRLAFLESHKRIPFWDKHPHRHVWVLSERACFTRDGGTDNAAYGFFWWDVMRSRRPNIRYTPTMSWLRNPTGKRWT